MAFDYLDNLDAREVEDQLLLGEGLMAARPCPGMPTGGMSTPPEPMKLLRLRAVDTTTIEEILPAGHHYIRCALTKCCCSTVRSLISGHSCANNFAELRMMPV